MRFNIVILGLVCVLLLPEIGLCDPSVLSVDGRGEVRFMPDIAHVHIVVEAKGDDPSAATAEVARIRHSVVEALENIDIPADDIKTVRFTVRDEMNTSFSDDEYIEIEFVARHLLSIKVVDFTKIGTTIDTCLSAGAAGLNRISYTSSQAAEFKDEALAKAVKDALRKAEIMARTVGGQLGVLLEMRASRGNIESASDSVSREAITTTPSTVIDPREVRATANVSAKWEYVPNND